MLATNHFELVSPAGDGVVHAVAGVRLCGLGAGVANLQQEAKKNFVVQSIGSREDLVEALAEFQDNAANVEKCEHAATKG